MLAKEELIINSIVFKEQLDKGVSQEELLERVSQLGFKRFEVRREMLVNPETDIQPLKEKADQLNIQLFYSVNEDIIVDNKVNPLVEQLIRETQVLGAPFLKINIGDASQVSIKELEQLSEILPKNLFIVVENNQDKHDASLKNCTHFISLAKQAHLPIHFVFDTANWAWVGETLADATAKLSADTCYIHAKNYLDNNGSLATSTSLFEGNIDFDSLLKDFPNAKYLALEYPTTEKQLVLDAELLGKDR